MHKRLTLAGVAVLLAVVGLLPVLAMISQSFQAEGGFSLRAYETLLASGGQQAASMGRSILLSSLTAALATAIGTPLGIILGKSDLPWRRTLTLLLTIPLLIPPYVLAVAWSGVLGRNGWVGQALAPSAADGLSAAFFGLPGCVGVLVTAFMPIVMLLTIAYVNAVNPRLEEAGRLASRWPNVVWRITLPLLLPAILFAAVIVFLLTFGEVGVPSFLRYAVYPRETLTQFAAFYDFGAATASAIPMLVVTLIILGLEYGFVHNRVLALSAATPGSNLRLMELGAWRSPLFGIVGAWALLTVLLPLTVLLVLSSSGQAFVEAFSRASDSVARSLMFAVGGATLLTALGFFCGYAIYDRTFALWRGIDALALFLFALPGTVIGIGLISLWNTPATGLIYATPAIVILGYLAQYAILPTRMTSAMLHTIPRSLEQAARISGANWFMTLRYILAPLATRGLIAAWLVSYVFCLRDLGISMVVYPPGSDTLPVRILTLMANGAPSLIAALCVILVAVTLLPLGAAGLWLRFAARTA
jgi:iron(III) transport system permease protein